MHAFYKSNRAFKGKEAKRGVYTYLKRRLEHDYFAGRRHPRLAVHLHGDLAAEVDLYMTTLHTSMS